MNSKSRQLLIVRFQRTFKICLLFLAFTPMGCGYPEVSPKTYEIAKALFSATNLRQTERIDELERMIDKANDTGEISNREAGYLDEVIEHGRAGDWEEAQQQARQLMEDQIGASPAKSKPHTH